ncbi:MAG: MlaD family protein [Myxococcales bacterium]
MDERRLELKVGALLLIAVLGAIGLLFLLGELRFGAGRRVFVDMNHTGGVADGAPVRLAGVRVGRVRDLKLFPDRRDVHGEPLPVQMTVDVNEDIFRALHADAQFVVATQGPLGEPFLEITPGSVSAPPLVEGSTVGGGDPPHTEPLASRAHTFLKEEEEGIPDDPESIQTLIRAAVRMTNQAENVFMEARPSVTQAADDLAAAARDLRTLAATANTMLARDGEARRVLGSASKASKTA